MKMNIFGVMAMVLFATGCHPQIPPSPNQNATVAWGQSPSCTVANPCQSYSIGRALAVSQTQCQPNTGTSYVQAGTVSTANATSFTDTTITITGYYCWIVQAIQNSQTGPPSVPSNATASNPSGVPLLVTEPPAAPPSPTVATQAAANEVPKFMAAPNKQLAANSSPVGVTASITKR